MAKLFTISELSKLLNLTSQKEKKPLNHILRYWEREFKIIKPRKIKAEISWLNNINTKTEINNGIFMYIISFLLVNLSIKYPAANNVITDRIE